MAYSTINKYSDHINTKLFTGNASADNAITGVGFQPDWVWLKDRVGTNNHSLYDSVRGVTKAIRTSTSGVETTTSGVTAFGADGFTVGDNAMGNAANAMVAWCWKAANGAGSSNTDGSITSTVSANTTAGFSIVSYTGTASTATVGHGLGVAPKMIIVKNLSSSENWGVWHTNLGEDEYLGLNQTNAQATNSAIWNSTYPTNSVFSIGNNARIGSSADFIAYCFAEVAGYSKMGEYRGNETSDNAFVYTGFKSSFILIKNYGAIDNWMLFDNKREGYNVDNDALHPNLNDAEQTDNEIDILSNGFKIRNSNQETGHNGHKYLYMAFGQPIISNSGVCATAR